jgi:hypothetical protein
MNVLLKCRMLVFLVPFLCFSFACKKKTSVTPPLPTLRHMTLSPGDTLGENLQEVDISPLARNEIITHLATVFNPRRCRTDDYYEITTATPPREWTDFKYYPPGIDFYALKKSTDGIVTAEKKTRAARKTISMVRGDIHTSLWESMRTKGIDPELIVGFADVFAWQIDFLTEPRVGDTFKIIWEQFTTDDGHVLNRQILSAQYIASGEDYTAFLFDRGNGQKDYYSPDGKALRSAFLKAPLQFRRISSFFSLHRFHPVLKIFRPHLGIDYAAPTGTPVSAIGEGMVAFAGRKGGFGNFIQVRHPNGYLTCYGHLSRYGKGIRSGVHVRQGQVIGYVGMTGLASGPHLDFRIAKDGQFLNFLKLKSPAAASIEAKNRQQFEELKKSYFARLSEIH